MPTTGAHSYCLEMSTSFLNPDELGRRTNESQELPTLLRGLAGARLCGRGLRAANAATAGVVGSGTATASRPSAAIRSRKARPKQPADLRATVAADSAQGHIRLRTGGTVGGDAESLRRHW